MSLEVRYKEQRGAAKTRGVPFLLTFDEWLQIWQQSGHLHERGRRLGQYCMARIGDVGPYSVDNVKIILHAENSREKKVSVETREKIGAIKRGLKASPETRAKMSISRRKWRGGMVGKRHSQETKDRIARSVAAARAESFWSKKGKLQ